MEKRVHFSFEALLGVGGRSCIGLLVPYSSLQNFPARFGSHYRLQKLGIGACIAPLDLNPLLSVLFGWFGWQTDALFNGEFLLLLLYGCNNFASIEKFYRFVGEIDELNQKLHNFMYSEFRVNPNTLHWKTRDCYAFDGYQNFGSIKRFYRLVWKRR